jgi:CRISPR-associated protein Csm4
MNQYKDYLIDLTPISSFEGFPTSDTIFGAICWAIRILPKDKGYGEEKLKEILKEFKENTKPPSFILSSAFPIIKRGSKEVYFFPKPFGEDLNHQQISDIANQLKEKIKSEFSPLYSDNLSLVVVTQAYKTFKKDKFVSRKLFSEILPGKANEYRLFSLYLDGKKFKPESFKPDPNDLGGKCKLINQLLMSHEEYSALFGETTARPKFLKEAIVQKNALNRINWATDPGGETFYSEEYYNSPNFKLFFLLRTTEDINFFKPIFRYLEDTGIGGNRSVGKNHFRIPSPSEAKFDFLSSNGNQKKFVTLSRFFAEPQEFELDDEKKRPYYELFSQRLKVESRFEFTGVNWKNLIFYFKEGSVFYAKKNELYYGSVKAVKEIGSTEIMQNCLAFPVFFQEKEG